MLAHTVKGVLCARYALKRCHALFTVQSMSCVFVLFSEFGCWHQIQQSGGFLLLMFVCL